mgnify:FL=1
MANMNANHDLSRFVSAQEGRYEMAYAELANGRKRSHWMWYIFPQLSGLGSSPMARRYALSGLEEAKAFLAHPLLGTRLVNISALLLSLDKGNPTEIFGFPDDIKLRSSMTLFALARPEEPVFEQVLDRFFGGDKDPLTLRLLRIG